MQRPKDLRQIGTTMRLRPLETPPRALEVVGTAEAHQKYRPGDWPHHQCRQRMMEASQALEGVGGY